MDRCRVSEKPDFLRKIPGHEFKDIKQTEENNIATSGYFENWELFYELLEIFS